MTTILNESDKLLLKFIQMLANIRKLFRLVHINIEKSFKVNNVETNVSPFEDEHGDLDEKVSISIFLDAELKQHINPERQSFVVSLTIRHYKQSWVAEGEIGWSGISVGWDNYIDREYHTQDINEFFIGLPNFVSELLNLYQVEFNKNTVL
jgi:hypothetical protein